MNAHARTSRTLVPSLDRLEDRKVLSHITHFAVHHGAHHGARLAAHAAAIQTRPMATAFVVPAAAPTANAVFNHGTATLNDGEVVVALAGGPSTSSNTGTISSNPLAAPNLGTAPSGTFMYGTATLSNGEVVGAYSSSFVR